MYHQCRPVNDSPMPAPHSPPSGSSTVVDNSWVVESMMRPCPPTAILVPAHKPPLAMARAKYSLPLPPGFASHGFGMTRQPALPKQTEVSSSSAPSSQPGLVTEHQGVAVEAAECLLKKNTLIEASCTGFNMCVL